MKKKVLVISRFEAWLIRTIMKYAILGDVHLRKKANGQQPIAKKYTFASQVFRL